MSLSWMIAWKTRTISVRLVVQFAPVQTGLSFNHVFMVRCILWSTSCRTFNDWVMWCPKHTHSVSFCTPFEFGCRMRVGGESNSVISVVYRFYQTRCQPLLTWCCAYQDYAKYSDQHTHNQHKRVRDGRGDKGQLPPAVLLRMYQTHLRQRNKGWNNNF